MSRGLIEQRRAAIKKHLFLLCPNNSGSTYLSRALATSKAVWSLPREGQHVIGFAGPSTIETPWPLIWAAREESLAHFRDSTEYDWDRTKRAWYLHASATRDDASVFHTKSPPFLLIADQLVENFLHASFIFMVRDPYAAVEGIMRRHRAAESDIPTEQLPQIAACHLLKCLEYQRANITKFGNRSVYFRYEDLCADPQAIAREIEGLVPELDDLNLTQRIAVKGNYDEPLRNMNDDQIAKLTPRSVSMLNEVFRPKEEILSYFGYSIRK